MPSHFLPHFPFRFPPRFPRRFSALAVACAALLSAGCTLGENIVIAPPDPPDVRVPSRAAVTDSVGRALAITPLSHGGPIQSWSVAPPLPHGLSLDTLTGEIAGAPREPWPLRTHVLTATGRGGSDTAVFTLRVVDRAPRITYGSPVVDTALRMSLHAPEHAGGTVDSFTISPPPADGYAFDRETGELAGYPLDSADATTYTIVAHGPMGNGTAMLTVSVVRPATFVPSGIDLGISVPATPGNAIARLLVEIRPLDGIGLTRRDTVDAADGFPPDSAARVFSGFHPLAPLRDWVVEVRALDASDSVVALGGDTVAALEQGETRAVTVSPAVRLVTYTLRVYLASTSEGYSVEPSVPLSLRRVAFLLGTDTLFDSTAAGGGFPPDAFAEITTRHVPLARVGELAFRVFGTAPGWDEAQPMLSRAAPSYVPGTVRYSVTLTYHGPGSTVPPP